MPKFTATEDFVPRGKWTALPQSGFRVHLTCPDCNRRYPIVHSYCGLHVEMYDALAPRGKCTACLESGHMNVSLPEDIADCPHCGLQCRSVEQVVGSDSIRGARLRSSKPSSQRRRPPRSKGLCSVCGSNYGIHTHHIDWNHYNDEASNLTTLCHYCHEQAHKLGKPLFDELEQQTVGNPDAKEALKIRSRERHRELFGPIPQFVQLSMIE